jgi:hypothetical protein
MMQDWYDKMVKALQLNGKGERSQQAHARAVRMLIDFYRKTADQPKSFREVSAQKHPKHFTTLLPLPGLIAHPTARPSSEPTNQKALPAFGWFTLYAVPISLRAS